MSDFLVTGAKGGSTAGALAPNRIEIYNFVKIEDQFSLYIQALAAMYAEKQENPLSHFGIGGIHGLPYAPWTGPSGEPDDASGLTSGEKSPEQWKGYCTHGTVLFPTWHRPYIALYEQVLQQHAIKIADTYVEDRERWNSAALNLRAPYWDWAANIIPPEEVISNTTLGILAAPDGKLTHVPNPLLQYTFNPIDESFFGRWENWKNTLRRPDSSDPNATSNVEALISELRGRRTEILEDTYNLLTRVRTWPAFSNHTTAPPGQTRNTNSLEAIHDRLHNYIGGVGHMGDSAVAGFDPIFYLHHANVDRLLALWSALRGSSIWVTEGPAQDGTWTIPAGSVIDKDTDLTPFRATQSGYWASTAITETSTLGYSYPEFNTIDEKPGSSAPNKIAAYINDLYGGSLLRLFGTSGPVAAVGSESPQRLNDWIVRIRFKKYELGQSFAVLIFLGDVPANAGEWRVSPKFVGTHVAFVSSAADQCANCRDQVDTETEGFVHLNSTIASQLTPTVFVGSFEPDIIVDYLKKNIQWRVQATDGSEIETSRLSSLEVTVAAASLRLELGADFPTDEDPIYYHDITRGRLGGARPVPA